MGFQPYKLNDPQAAAAIDEVQLFDSAMSATE
jgi:hypothetical protein